MHREETVVINYGMNMPDMRNQIPFFHHSPDFPGRDYCGGPDMMFPPLSGFLKGRILWQRTHVGSGAGIQYSVNELPEHDGREDAD